MGVTLTCRIEYNVKKRQKDDTTEQDTRAE